MLSAPDLILTDEIQSAERINLEWGNMIKIHKCAGRYDGLDCDLYMIENKAKRQRKEPPFEKISVAVQYQGQCRVVIAETHSQNRDDHYGQG